MPPAPITSRCSAAAGSCACRAALTCRVQSSSAPGQGAPVTNASERPRPAPDQGSAVSALSMCRCAQKLLKVGSVPSARRGSAAAGSETMSHRGGACCAPARISTRRMSSSTGRRARSRVLTAIACAGVAPPAPPSTTSSASGSGSGTTRNATARCSRSSSCARSSTPGSNPDACSHSNSGALPAIVTGGTWACPALVPPRLARTLAR